MTGWRRGSSLRSVTWAGCGLALVVVAGLIFDAVRPTPVAAPECRIGAVPSARPVSGVSPPAAGRRWGPPQTRPIRLLDLPVETLGDPPQRGDGVIAHFDRAALAGWRSEPLEGGVRLFGPEGLPDLQLIDHVRIAVAPGVVDRISVILLGDAEAEAAQPEDRPRPRVSVALPAPSGDTRAEPVEVMLSVRSLLGGFWADVVDARTLRGIEVDLHGASATPEALLDVRIESAHARFVTRALGREQLELEGLRRPGLFVNGGARAHVRVSVPPQGGELRWHEGATAGETALVVRVLGAAGGSELSRHPGASAWRQRTRSLDAWAGKEVVLELAAEGAGVALFGDPRIVPRAPAPVPGGPPASAGSTPDVLVYMIDTLRADFVGHWHEGGPNAPLHWLEGRSATPHIDRLAREGLVFGRAFSTSAWTRPAISTLLTGIHPTTHGMSHGAPFLPDSVAMIQDRFGAAGWRTVSLAANPHGSSATGLDRGFDAAYLPFYWEDRKSDFGHPGADVMHASLYDWIREEPDRPFFAYVHTLEVHEFYKDAFQDLVPDSVPTSLRDPFAYAMAVLRADREFGALWQHLRAERRGRPLLIVLLSDHGEAFGDHGYRSHGYALYSSQTHIPLVFWASAGLPAATLLDPVSLADVAPTLLDWMGLEPLEDSQGRSLAGYAEGRAPRDYASVPMSLIAYPWAPDAPQQYALVDRATLQKVHRIGGSSPAHYDLADDPCEIRGRMEAAAALDGALERWLAEQARAAERFEARHGAATTEALSAEDLMRLEALGYVE